MIRRPRKSHGISLIEVLATLVLIGIVVPAAMHGVNLCLRAASTARHQQEASFLAESWMNEVLTTRDVSLLGTSGTFGDDWPEYRWAASVLTRDFNLSEVELVVTWQERGQERTFIATTLVYPDASLTSGTTTGGTSNFGGM